MNPLSDARRSLADLLQPLGHQVYAYPVAVPSPPCITVFAQDNWVVNPRLNGHWDLRLSLRLATTTAGGNESALSTLEQMVWDVTRVIPVTNQIQAPKLDVSGPADCYVVDLATFVTT